MHGVAKIFSGSLVTGLLLASGSGAQSLAPPRDGARPVTDEAAQRQIRKAQGTGLYFPDYVEGGGWSVQLVLSNVGATAATAIVEVYGKDGQSVTDLFVSGSTLEIPSLGSRVLRSTGGGALRRGWIEVRIDSDSVNGLLTYRHTQTGIEVGVQPIEPGNQFGLSVEETREIGTGLAIFKPDASAEIEFQMRDEDGRDPIGEVVRWRGFRQEARTLPEWFENVDTGFLADFRGLLFLRSTDDSDFTPLGLRFGKQKGSLSAVPVIRNPSQEIQESPLYFPDYVDGDGWSVQLVLSNVGAIAATAVVEVYGKDGQPVTDLFDSGSTVGIPSLGNRILKSTGTETIRRGWIEVRTEPGTVSGLLTYRHVETGIEVGVQPIELGSHFALSVEETNEIGTGLAIFKPDASPDIEFRIHDEEGSDPIGEVVRWGAFQQEARTLPEWFDRVDTGFLADFRGLLFLRATDGSDFAPLGLRFGKQKGSLSAVPVIPIRDAGTGKMYWTNYDGDRIQRANLDGSGVEDLVTSGLSLPASLALDLGVGKMYWTDSGTDKIQRANLDGSGVEDLLSSGLRHPIGLVLDLGAGKMYWTDLFNIQRANLDGSRVEGLITGTSGVTNIFGLALELDNGKIYWTRSEKIQRANLDGSGVEDVVTLDMGVPYGLALGAGKMYWTDSFKIRRANLDGSGAEDLVTSGLRVPYALALDLGAGKMYWTDARTSKIQRANLDGGGVEDLVTSGLRSPRGLALDPGSRGGGSPTPVPPTARLLVSPTSIERGRTATLTWSSTNAVSATITPGIGAVPTSGSRDVSPASTTTYRLTVRNATGQAALATATVTVTAPPDLVVETPSVSVSALTTGQSFEFRATVRNQGGRRSDTTTLRYFRSNDTTISNGDTLVGTDAVNALPASGSSAESIGLTAPSNTGTYYYGACVDPVNGESRTGNNCSQSVRVTVSEGSSGVGKMYWADSGTGKVQRANLDGSQVEDLVTSGRPNGIALDSNAGKMYWTDSIELRSGIGKIRRANLDGSQVEDLVTTGAPSSIALDPDRGKMYWTDAFTDAIRRANLDGSGVEDLVTTGMVVHGALPLDRAITLDPEGEKMYWTDSVQVEYGQSGRDKIQRANLDGSQVETLVTTGLRSPNGIALDPGAGKMYWTDSGRGKIQRANLDGSQVEDLITTGLRAPNGIVLDPDREKMYWTDFWTDKIHRANLDGSQVETLVTTERAPVGGPQGIALDLVSGR